MSVTRKSENSESSNKDIEEYIFVEDKSIEEISEDVNNNGGVDSLKITTTGEYDTINIKRNHMHVMCTIAAPITKKKERAPIDLVCVVDKSRSMAGEKLRLVKEACSFIVQELKEGDHFCLVTYDTYVDNDFMMSNMTNDKKELALKCIESIKERSKTNLSGGLFRGIKHANNSLSNNLVSSIWLFTDGIANKGIIEIDEIIKSMNKLLGKNSTKTVFTFGFGEDHKADMLGEIADKGNGMYYYIEGSKDIGPSFADCLGGVFSVFAQNINLTIEPIDCKIIKVLGVVKNKKGRKDNVKNNNDDTDDASIGSHSEDKVNEKELKKEEKREKKENTEKKEEKHIKKKKKKDLKKYW